MAARNPDSSKIGAGAEKVDPLPEAEVRALEPAVEILRPLLRDPRHATQVVATIATTVESFRSPLPSPDHFRGYDDVVPGGARELLDMATREQRHRHKMQLPEMVYPYLGWFAGFVGFVASVGCATYLALNDHELIAGAMLSVPCLGVIGWFIRSRVSHPQPAASPGRTAKKTPRRR
jgi:hypothetical protein